MDIGLVLTTFNESRKPGRLERAVAIAVDERISEVVISDDASDDTEDLIDRLKSLTAAYPELKPKLRLITQTTNLGVFCNKLAAIRAARSRWLQSLDSDNELSVDYLNYLENCLTTCDNSPLTMLCPSFGKPSFDYREIAGRSIRLENFAELLDWEPFSCFLNTGNQCFNRQQMLRVTAALPESRYDLWAHNYFDRQSQLTDMAHRLVYDSADSFCFNKLWLLAGGELFVGPGLEYTHNVHALSSWRAAPALKEALPPIYFRELQDAALGHELRYGYRRLRRSKGRACVELSVNGQVADPPFCVDLRNGNIVEIRRDRNQQQRRRHAG